MESTSKKNILLVVCGGIAAYKSAELVRLLRTQKASVRVVMTENAQKFVSPMTFQALSGHAVHSKVMDENEENAMGHINLARWADALVFAPATANVIAKCAHGIADDLATTLYLAATCPIYLAPAMNQAMWAKPVTQENIVKLTESGACLIGPNAGDQACGETGYGRMAEPPEICAHVLREVESRALDQMKVLITAGPTREYLDPVRFISNRSSGKMGYALASAARAAGAEVTLVSGPVHLSPPAGVTVINVESTAQMYSAVLQQALYSDIFIGTAAVADYRPTTVETAKIKKNATNPSLDLEKTEDILASVAALDPRPFTVGFAAETDNLEQYAIDKLAKKRLDMIAANWVGRERGGFDSNDNALEVFWPTGRASLGMTDKNNLAKQLIELIATRFNEKNRS